MKKVITILAIAIILVGAAFAASGEHLTVTATVANVPPVFVMKGSTTEIAATATAWASAGQAASTSTDYPEIASSIDPSTGEVVAYIAVLTNGVTKFQGSLASLTVTAGPLTYAEDSSKTATVKSNSTTAVGVTTKSLGDSKPVDLAVSAVDSVVGTVTYSLSFNGAQVATGALVGRTLFTWNKVTTLPAGSYSADIQMTYTAN